MPNKDHSYMYMRMFTKSKCSLTTMYGRCSYALLVIEMETHFLGGSSRMSVVLLVVGYKLSIAEW